MNSFLSDQNIQIPVLTFPRGNDSSALPQSDVLSTRGQRSPILFLDEIFDNSSAPLPHPFQYESDPSDEDAHEGVCDNMKDESLRHVKNTLQITEILQHNPSENDGFPTEVAKLRTPSELTSLRRLSMLGKRTMDESKRLINPFISAQPKPLIRLRTDWSEASPNRRLSMSNVGEEKGLSELKVLNESIRLALGVIGHKFKVNYEYVEHVQLYNLSRLRWFYEKGKAVRLQQYTTEQCDLNIQNCLNELELNLEGSFPAFDKIVLEGLVNAYQIGSKQIEEDWGTSREPNEKFQSVFDLHAGRKATIALTRQLASALAFGEQKHHESRSSHLECKFCASKIVDFHLHCKTCQEGNFNICSDCVDKGKRCADVNHDMIKRMVSFGRIVHLSESPPNPGPGHPEHYDRTACSEEPLIVALNRYSQIVDMEHHPAAEAFAIMESTWGEPDTSDQNAADLLRGWGQVCLLLARDELQPSFKSTLWPNQLASIGILLEWWVSTICDHHLISWVIRIIITCCASPSITLNGLFAARNRGRTSNPYMHSLATLLVEEFRPWTKAEGDAALSRLVKVRASAAASACVQRLGCLSIHMSLTPRWLHNRYWRNASDLLSIALENYEDLTFNPWMLLGKTFGYKQADTNRFCNAYVTATVGPCVLFAVNAALGEQILGDRKLSGTIAPCPWLDRSRTLALFPHYLWDTQKRETVETSRLVTRPAYTVISHTWGRWKLADNGVDHPGVPWLIPLNARFDARNLPDLLSHVPGGNRYIWLDLVCVPQGNVDSVLSRVRKQEIGRQASIFGNAQYAIAWFNDYDSFGSLELWISWIVRRLYLRNSP